MAALKGGLQKNDLLFSLEKYPRNFVDMLARVDCYARVEEAFKAKDGEATKEQSAGKSNKPATEGRPSEARSHSRTPLEHKQSCLLLVDKEALIKGHNRILPRQSSTTMLPSMLQEQKC